MGVIRHLSPHVVAKIAAGEIIERPASVVKELIENSLDAGATSITVEVEEAGSKKITVTDNGRGMDSDDLRLAATRHTTSKIASEDDLFQIYTLGFRGEALASIAAVSTLTIRSRQQTATGGSGISIEKNAVKKEFSLGMPVGTRVIVEHLFSATPARKEFLKEPTTELRHIIAVITEQALIHNTVRFCLFHNGSSLFLFPPQDLEERVATILGKHFADSLIPVSLESPHSRISGYISKPQRASQSQVHQYLFINNRTVQPGLVANIIREAYGTLIPAKLFPPFILYLTLPKEYVDVHVHPRKEEVRLLNFSEVANDIKTAVVSALQKVDLAYQFSEFGSDGASILHDRSMSDYMADMLKGMGDTWHPTMIDSHEILQIRNLYLLAHSKIGIVIVDQHAAHECILFEEFRTQFEKLSEQDSRYYLPTAKTFEVPHMNIAEKETHLGALQKLGFDIEDFGGNVYKLNAVPFFFKDRDHVGLVMSILDDISNEILDRPMDEKTHRTLAYLACRGAVKAGDPLSIDERKNLIEKLLEHPEYVTCPHGRPTKVEVTMRDLDHMFKRK